jgi:arginyl-tRNA synthetase
MNPSTPRELQTHLRQLFEAALLEVAPEIEGASIVLERPKLASHGDYSCNLALQLARALHAKPREVAARLLDALPDSTCVERAEVAGAGFINLFLRPSFKKQIVNRVLKAGPSYGMCTMGMGQRVQVEFVSANPTGPLHVGHGRGAAFGASLASVLAAVGYAVTREFYVNDAGRQMDILALSTWLRYLELAGERVPPHLRGLRYRHGAAIFVRASSPSSARAGRSGPFEYFHDFALNEQLADCRDDLTEFGVTFEHWFSERSLHDSGLVQRAMRELDQRGHVYEQDGARWFRSSTFGDEKDRVIQRENGMYTYFASDIAFISTSSAWFDRVIDVWGADHHGYIPRVRGALQALGRDPEQLAIALVQFAVLYRNGQKVSMSTRAGEFVTLRELRREVGNDAARFFYVLRKSDQHLDFDLDLAKAQSNENPVYYIQYAHARVCSVHEQWGGDPASLVDVDAAPLASVQEFGLLQRLADYPEAVEQAARELAPHLIAFYLRDLAAEFPATQLDTAPRQRRTDQDGTACAGHGRAAGPAQRTGASGCFRTRKNVR